MKRPNIVLCTSDQLRPFELGCYGGAVRTPNIDRIAGRGTRWETAITNFPVCMAARSVLISGQMNRTATGGRTNIAYAARDGDFAMPEYPYARRPHLPHETLPEALQALGYRTSVIGKWHIHSWPHEIGFDHYLIPRVHHAHSAQIFSRDGGPEFAPPGYSVDFEAGEVERFLKDQDGEAPFFLYYNISPPHCPLADMPDEYLTLYDPAEIALRANTSEPDIADRDYWYRVYRWDFRYYSFHLPHTETLPEGYGIRHLAAEYYGAVTWMDAAVGRMLDALEAAGLADDTIVVFASDHGENLGSHGLVQKGTENDESIRIPLAMAGPGIAKGAQVENSVASLVDLMPTLLEMAGGAVPDHCHGASLADEAARGAGDGRSAFFEQIDGAGMRGPDETLFVPFEAGTRTLAARPRTRFDNRADPLQFDNLAFAAAASSLDDALRAADARFPWSQLEDDPS